MNEYTDKLQEWVDGEITDADEKTGLWSLFDSTERSAIKSASKQA